MLRYLTELPLRFIALLADGIEVAIRLSGRALGNLDAAAEGEHSSLGRSCIHGILATIRFVIHLICYPISGFLYRGERFRHFLFSLPFVVCLVGLVGLWVVAAIYQERIQNRYLSRVQNAFTKGKGTLGVRNARRWIDQTRYVSPDKEFLYSLVQIQDGNVAVGERILEKLAPEEGIGYGAAHFWKASQIAKRFESEVTSAEDRSELLRELDRHLQRSSGVAPSQVSRLKGLLAYWNGDRSLAESIYRELWEKDPYQTFAYAKFLEQIDDRETRNQVLSAGITRLKVQLQMNPVDREARGGISAAYESLKDWTNAETTLLDGIGVQQDGWSIEQLRSFYIRRLVNSEVDQITEREFSYFLVRSFRTEGPSERVLNSVRESLFFQPVKLKRVQQELSRWLVEGLDPPIAHSCLAYVELFLENTEVADWHLEQAIRVEKDLQSSIGSSAAYLRSNWAIPGTLASVLERWQVPQQRPFD